MSVTPPFVENSTVQQMHRQYQRLQHDKTWSIFRFHMCKTMHETCCGEGSYNVHSKASMTQLSNGRISSQRKGYSIMYTLFIQKRKWSLRQAKDMPSALRQSVDILGEQNNYSTSIASAQRQLLRHDFYSERSISYALCLHSAHPATARAHARTSKHKPAYEVDWTSKQAKGTVSSCRTRKSSNT